LGCVAVEHARNKGVVGTGQNTNDDGEAHAVDIANFGVPDGLLEFVLADEGPNHSRDGVREA